MYSNRLSLKSHLRNPALHLNEPNSETNSVPKSSKPLSGEGTQCTFSENEYKNGNGENCNDTVIISDLKLEMMKHAVSLFSDELISRKKSLEMLKQSFGYYSKAILSYRGCIKNQNFEEFCEFFDDPSSIQSEHLN